MPLATEYDTDLALSKEKLTFVGNGLINNFEISSTLQVGQAYTFLMKIVILVIV